MPALGTTVKYAVTAGDADRITRNFGKGVIPNAGDVLPAVVTKDKTTKVDLQVFLNGEGTFWVQDVLNIALVP
jgi:hypothetical protein